MIAHSVRPELVEGSPVHGSTGSPRTNLFDSLTIERACLIGSLVLMSRSRIALLMTACLIAFAVACSSGDSETPAQPAPQEAPTSAPATSAQAQPTAPPPTTAPAPTSTSAPAPTAAPASAATSDASAPATVSSEDDERELKIVTLLPFDAIPAILDPEFISAEEASEQLEDHNLVLGLSINGDHRAYSIPTLSSHEIVNDVVGGEPVAVTW